MSSLTWPMHCRLLVKPCIWGFVFVAVFVFCICDCICILYLWRTCWATRQHRRCQAAAAASCKVGKRSTLSHSCALDFCVFAFLHFLPFCIFLPFCVFISVSCVFLYFGKCPTFLWSAHQVQRKHIWSTLYNQMFTWLSSMKTAGNQRWIICREFRTLPCTS